MTLPSLETIASYVTLLTAVCGALMAALWFSLVIWTFRDMRQRSRDPFAQILATIVVALLPIVGIIVYIILRPPETLAEAYERALEEEALLQEIEERPACPNCSRTVDVGWILCPYCQTRVRKRCPDCEQLLELPWELCPFCGHQQVDPYRAEPPPVIREAAQPAKRHVAPVVDAPVAPDAERETLSNEAEAEGPENGQAETSR